MNPWPIPVPRFKEAPAAAGPQEELVRRVASSCTFEKSPRLRALFLQCGCIGGAVGTQTSIQRIARLSWRENPALIYNADGC